MAGGGKFEPRLESLRGIAALIVAAHHGMMTFISGTGDRPVILSSIFDVLWVRLTNPGLAVLFFFVLSGYVLGQSLTRDGDYWRFMIRRAFRILPAFVVSVLFAYACVTLVRMETPPADLTEFFKRPFWPMPTIGQLFENLFLRSVWINGPTWSIKWEIVGSIWLPGLVYLHTKTPEKLQIALFLCASAFISFVHIRATNYVLLNIVQYFYAGFFLPPLISRWMPDNWLFRLTTFVLGYWMVLQIGATNAGDFAAICPGSIGASMMIGAVLSSRDFLNWLRLPPLRFLGRVSYSFYLFHWPMFYLTAMAFLTIGALPRGELGNWIICMVSIVSALAVSAASYRWIELPFNRAGHAYTPREAVIAPAIAGERLSLDR
jgi:peptidoglycan/LPS O-acetylase OafA/YrhL